jgi:Holliday junction resolvasome RuvABC DNA-binding subunit
MEFEKAFAALESRKPLMHGADVFVQQVRNAGILDVLAQIKSIINSRLGMSNSNSAYPGQQQGQQQPQQQQGPSIDPQVRNDAIEGLCNLGYTKRETTQIVDYILQQNPTLTTSQVVTQALRIYQQRK